MNPRHTALLLVLASALGAFVYFYELGGEAARKQAEDDTKRLFPGLEAEAFEFIEFTTSDGRNARLERVDGAFTLVAPLDFPADAFTADALAAGLAGLKGERKLESPQAPEVYGLGSDASHIAFGVGGERRGIRVGKDAPVGDDTYVSLVGSDDVHLVKSYSVKAFEKTLDDLRRKRVAPFDRESIDRIELIWRDGRAVVERTAEGWSLLEPLRGPADAGAIDRVLSDLSFLRAAGFVDNPGPEAEFGLAEPDLEVRLRGKSEAEGDEPIEIRLAFGQPDASGIRLVRAGLPSLFRVPVSSFDALPTELIQLRFRTLAEFDAFDAKRMEITFQGAETLTIHAQRNEDGWSSEPEAMAPESLRALVRRLARLKAVDILAEEMGRSELHALELDPSNATYRVFGADRAPPDTAEPAAALLLGEVHLGRVRSDGRIVAQTADSPIVYALEAAFAQEVPVSLDAFRNRFVVEPEPEPPPDPEVGAETVTEGAASVSPNS